MTDTPASGSHVLDTPTQRRLEAGAAAVLAELGPGVLDEIVDQVSARSQLHDAGVRSYARELLRCTALQSLAGDPFRPEVLWNLFPGARAGLDNPDTRYRFAAVAAHSTYELRGRRNSSTDVSFQLFDAWQGDGLIGQQLAFLGDSELAVADDGTFVVTLDASPADGRANHVQLLPTAQQLTVRDTLADWTLEPMELEIRRIAGPDAAPAPSFGQLVERTVARTRLQAAFWPPIVDAFLTIPAQSLGRPNPTPGGLASQYSAPGHYRVADGPMVIRLGAGDARYVGIQLGSGAFISLDYWDRPTSLNPSQLVADEDGSFTIVVDSDDPGVANWLDPGDCDEGIIFIRWQAMSGALPVAHHPRAATVPRRDLAAHLDGSPGVGPGERSAAAARRRRTVARLPDQDPEPGV